MKRSVAVLLGVLLSALLLLSTGPAATAASYCGITWGSLAETRPIGSIHASLTNIRGGTHTCYDRLVLDVRGDIRGFDVRYVCVVLREGSGDAVPLRGTAVLQVIAFVPDHDPAAQTFYRTSNASELVPVARFGTFRQVAYAGSFEGRTNIGLGVRELLPFRAFVLDGPGSGSRLFVDVAHQW